MIDGVAAACVAAALTLQPDNGLLEPERVPAAWLNQHPMITRLMELQNEERARYGLPPLRYNAKMTAAAQKHASWMADTGYYTHSGLPWPEIIHSGPQTPEGAVQGWIYSPSHHGIMLSGSQAGFGYAKRNGVAYWVTVIE